MKRLLILFAFLHLACSADTSGPPVSSEVGTSDVGTTEGGTDTRPATETGGTCKDPCSATEKCWPASCTGAACGGTTVTVPADSRCINGCCETLEQSCDRVCPG
jgi:hypothetical protein